MDGCVAICRNGGPPLLRGLGHAFRQQNFDVAQAKGELEVEPYRLMNDLGREPVAGIADLGHPIG